MVSQSTHLQPPANRPYGGIALSPQVYDWLETLAASDTDFSGPGN